MGKKHKMILAGIHYNAVEAHIIDCENNSYIDGFFILGDEQRIINKIKIIMQVYPVTHVIPDQKTTPKSVYKLLQEEGIISHDGRV